MADPAGLPSVHASCVQVGSAGILIRGAPGSGKSALALALVEDPRADAGLVADDRVALHVAAGSVVASAPPELAGLVELRGFGILKRPAVAEAEVRLVVDLVPAREVPRLPEPAALRTRLDGVDLPRLALPAGLPDLALRVRLALAELAAGRWPA